MGLVALLAGATMLLSAGTAQAVTTDIYDNFTRCPTSAPLMNDPAYEGVVCASTIVREGLVRVGNFQAPINSPVRSQFAMVVNEGKLTVVPGSTSMESTPFTIPNPFFTPPTPAAGVPGTPQPPKKAKKKHKKVKKHHKKKGQKGKKKGHKKHHKKKKHKKKKPQPVPPVVPPVQPDPFIKVTVEPIGDIRDVNLEAVLGGEGPLYRLNTRIHLEGTGLGPNCFIGTSAEPIELEPEIANEPSGFTFGKDPNGLPVEVLALDGLNTEDESYPVPGASGCGEGASVDQQINAAIGLPVIAGGAKVIFANTRFEMVGAENDGTAPDGGALLQAAFDAAK